MRYFLGCLIMVLAVPVWAYNESVAAISFNPSRTGSYKYLKIAKSAEFFGIDATAQEAEINITTAGTVSVEGGVDCSPAACHQIQEIKPAGSSKYCENNPEAEVCTGENVYQTKLLTDSGSVVQKGIATLTLPNIENAESIDIDLATYGINIYMQGGTLTSRNEASAFVRQFVADHSKISLNAGTLNADDKKINIVGNNSYGLKLGAVWIQRNNLSASQNLQFESLETSKGNAKVLQIK